MFVVSYVGQSFLSLLYVLLQDMSLDLFVHPSLWQLHCLSPHVLLSFYKQNFYYEKMVGTILHAILLYWRIVCL